MRKKIIGLVSNNIATDQRLLKTGMTLQNNGFDFQLIGSSHTSSPDLSHIPFQTKRINFIFSKNWPFYAELQLKLLLNLIRKDHKNAIILANDLDTLLPAKLITDFYKMPLVADFHEIFSEMPTLKPDSIQKNTWQWLEKKLLPGIGFAYTVSDTYANFFNEKYGIRPEIIYNVPFLSEKPDCAKIKNDKKILLYQGAMNFSRGIDNMIQAMQYIENAELHLIGDGPYLKDFQLLSKTLKLESKVNFFSSKTPDELKKITPIADLGLSLEEDKGLSYRYALPNKIFDYIHAEIPVLGSSDLVEVKNLIDNYKIGDYISNHDPRHIADKIKNMLTMDKSFFIPGLMKAKTEFNWQNQEEKLIRIFEKAANE